MKESLEDRFSFWRFHHAFTFQHHSKSENGDHVNLWVTWKNVYIVPGALKKKFLSVDNLRSKGIDSLLELSNK